MLKRNRLLITFSLIMSLSACSVKNNSPMPPDGGEGKTVRNLCLKYSIISTAYEIYQTQVIGEEPFNRETYEKIAVNTPAVLDHYNWMEATYEEFPDKRKRQLNYIFSNSIDWPFMNITTALSDDASIDDFLTMINTMPMGPYIYLRHQMGSFYKYFYENGFNNYLHGEQERLMPLVNELNEITKREGDILPFMERVSGMTFSEMRRPLFYLSLRPIGASGFEYGSLHISTIQQTTKPESLFGTPFHEFSHDLFQQFTRNPQFAGLCEELKNDITLKEEQRSSYDWIGWCEENLVEGFAQYLEDRYYGTEETREIKGIYVYDSDFYVYLKTLPFDPEKQSLEEASLEFYRSRL